MKICLVDTAAVDSSRLIPHWTPLGPAYIAAKLMAGGHQVAIIERDVIFRKSGLSLEKTDRVTAGRIRDFDPDMVGISSPTQLFSDAVRVAGLARKVSPGATVSYGGHHASAAPAEILEVCPDMDLTIPGEGEETMLELADGLDHREIRGVCYREDETITINPPRRPIEPLDSLPPPSRHLLDMDFHTRPSHTPIRALPLRTTTMLTSRGCPFSCRFCVEPLPFGRKHRCHSVDRVLSELDDILSRYDIEAVIFLDEGFTAAPSRAEELCLALIREGYHRRVKWAAQARADSLDRDILALMREAGCLQLECGFETGSDRLLGILDKRTSGARNLEAVELIKSSGIRCLANLIVGLPGETEEDFQMTLKFARDGGADYVVFSRLAIHPGSAIFDDLVEKGIIHRKIWAEDDDFSDKVNLTAMSDERFKELYRQARKEVVDPINTRDRMRHTSLLKRIRGLSIRELAYTLRHTPAMITGFIVDWFRIKLSKA
jgi:radical SAM superfamily enzyme YgiQ (UPF0313 family)